MSRTCGCLSRMRSLLTVGRMASPQVVVVGSYVQDLCWKCERFPQAGQTIVGQFSTGPGGKGSNQAVAAGRTGVSTLFVGAVGDDAFAREAKAFYKAEGIGARFVRSRRMRRGRRRSSWRIPDRTKSSWRSARMRRS